MGTGAMQGSWSIATPYSLATELAWESAERVQLIEPLNGLRFLLFLNSFSYRWLLFGGPGSGPGTARMAHVSEAGKRHWRRC